MAAERGKARRGLAACVGGELARKLDGGCTKDRRASLQDYCTLER